jgi:hypothetical protein
MVFVVCDTILNSSGPRDFNRLGAQGLSPHLLYGGLAVNHFDTRVLVYFYAYIFRQPTLRLIRPPHTQYQISNTC